MNESNLRALLCAIFKSLDLNMSGRVEPIRHAEMFAPLFETREARARVGWHP